MADEPRSRSRGTHDHAEVLEVVEVVEPRVVEVVEPQAAEVESIELVEPLADDGEEIAFGAFGEEGEEAGSASGEDASGGALNNDFFSVAEADEIEYAAPVPDGVRPTRSEEADPSGKRDAVQAVSLEKDGRDPPVIDPGTVCMEPPEDSAPEPEPGMDVGIAEHPAGGESGDLDQGEADIEPAPEPEPSPEPEFEPEPEARPDLEPEPEPEPESDIPPEPGPEPEPEPEPGPEDAQTPEREPEPGDGDGERSEIEMAEAVLKSRLSRSEPGPAGTCAMDVKEAMEAAKPVLDRLVRQLERTFSFYTTSLHRDPVTKIFCSGELASSGPLNAYFSSELGMEIEVLDSLEPHRSTAGAMIPDSREERLAYNIANALALCDNSYTPNLLYTFKEKRQAKKNRLIVHAVYACFILVLLALSGVHFWIQSDIADHKQRLAGVEAVSKRYRPKASRTSLMGLAARISGKKRAVLKSARNYLSLAVIGEVIRLTPDDAELFSLDVVLEPPLKKAEGKDEKKKPQTAPAFAGDTVVDGVFTGTESRFDTLLTDYLLALQSSPVFAYARVKEKEVLQTKLGPVLHFTIRAGIAKE